MTTDTTRKNLNHLTVEIRALEWFDSINGNSYFSARIYVEGDEVARIPFGYGYGDQYKQEGIEALLAAGYGNLADITYDNGLTYPAWQVSAALGFHLHASITDAKKRDVKEWGKA